MTLETSKSGTKWWRIATAAVMALILLTVLGGGIYMAVANAALRADLTAASDKLYASQENAEVLYQQLIDEGVSPEAEKPSDVVTTTGATGATGSRGTDGRDGRDGTDGVNGVDGVGPPGSPGADGATGPPGPSGPPGADGKDGADGSNGTNGEPGAQGPAGRGLASIECQPDGIWLITYTDGTTATTPGPCTLIPSIPSIPEGPTP